MKNLNKSRKEKDMKILFWIILIAIVCPSLLGALYYGIKYIAGLF